MSSRASGEREKRGKVGGARRLWGCLGMVLGGVDSPLSHFSSLPSPFGPWRLERHQKGPVGRVRPQRRRGGRPSVRASTGGRLVPYWRPLPLFLHCRLGIKPPTRPAVEVYLEDLLPTVLLLLQVLLSATSSSDTSHLPHKPMYKKGRRSIRSPSFPALHSSVSPKSRASPSPCTLCSLGIRAQESTRNCRKFH